MSNVMVILYLVISTVLLSQGPGHKIEICHVPPGNPANAHTIEVDKNAWTNGHSPHNAHSLDYLGACPTPTPEPTSPPVSTPTSTPDILRTPEPTPTDIPPTVVSTPSVVPTVPEQGPKICNAPALEALADCDTCAQLGAIIYELGRIANALEAANE